MSNALDQTVANGYIKKVRSATKRAIGKDLNMTQQEQALADDKMRAEIAKLMAETAKINRETLFYPMIVASTATLAIVAVVKTLL